MQVAVEGIVETLRGVPPARFQPGEVCARLQGVQIAENVVTNQDIGHPPGSSLRPRSCSSTPGAQANHRSDFTDHG